jgi:2-dehydropantoate 2-reductase
MVGFNVADVGKGHWHRGTDGYIAAQDAPVLRQWQDVFANAGLPLQLHADLQTVQWGKLLLNLNNPVNALSGLPLRAQLLNRTHRRLFADLVAEALPLLREAGIEPARLTPLPWNALVRLLRMPTPVFRLVAARMLRIDARARSSMADDLALGRPTEIDALSGEIVRLAERLGRSAPLNARMVERIRERSLA